jgi:hypothetical protein
VCLLLLLKEQSSCLQEEIEFGFIGKLRPFLFYLSEVIRGEEIDGWLQMEGCGALSAL